MTTKTTRASDEFRYVQTIISDLTTSVLIALMDLSKIEALESAAATNSVMKALCSELKRALKAIRQPEDHDAMAQAYEAYTEAVVCDEFCRRGVVLERTPGTGDYRQKRPDFHPSGGGGRDLRRGQGSGDCRSTDSPWGDRSRGARDRSGPGRARVRQAYTLESHM